MNKYGIYSRIFKEKERAILIGLLRELTQRGHGVAIYEPYYQQIRDVVSLSTGIDTFDDRSELDLDLIITIGGDGTLLSSIGLTDRGNIPILGINTGRLGFLTSVSGEDLKRLFIAIDRTDYSIENRGLIGFNCADNFFGDKNYALNECVVIKNDSTSMITVHLLYDDEFINSYWCDGIIVSTPTGSTGYSLSCGGPIVMPGSDSWVISPVAPHNLSTRPLVVPDDKRLKLIVEGRGDNFLCNLDSRTAIVPFGTEITLQRASFDLKFVRLNDYSFIATTREKLLWGSEPRNEVTGWEAFQK